MRGQARAGMPSAMVIRREVVIVPAERISPELERGGDWIAVVASCLRVEPWRVVQVEVDHASRRGLRSRVVRVWFVTGTQSSDPILPEKP
jgi:hypothetical protein